MPYNFGKGSGIKGKGKIHKGQGFQPEPGEQRKFGGYCNWCWRIGHKEAQCWFNQEYMKSNPSQDPLQRERFVNGQTRQRKGKVTTSPRANAKVKARTRKTSRKREPQTRSRLDLQMKMDSARWVILVESVKELNLSVMSKRIIHDFESHRLDRAAYVFCVQKCNSISMDSTELPSSSKRVCDGYEEPAGTHEKLDQSTGEVLFAVGCRDDRPIVDPGSVVSTCPVDYAT